MSFDRNNIFEDTKNVNCIFHCNKVKEMFNYSRVGLYIVIKSKNISLLVR